MNKVNFYKNRISLNVLAKDIENAKEVIEATEGNVVVGVLSKNFKNDKEAIKEISKWQLETGDRVSIGLGAGDPNQTYMVARLCKELKPAHANQVFTGVGLTNYDFENCETFINCLVSPTGKPGFVKINTGPISCKMPEAIVDVNTAIGMIKDMGGNSIKFFPMNGLDSLEELKVVSDACYKNNFALEPTGGIDLENFEIIMKTIIDSKVEKIIPHIYGSIINKENGKTEAIKVKELYRIVKELLKNEK